MEANLLYCPRGQTIRMDPREQSVVDHFRIDSSTAMRGPSISPKYFFLYKKEKLFFSFWLDEKKNFSLKKRKEKRRIFIVHCSFLWVLYVSHDKLRCLAQRFISLLGPEA